tara:strand:- start:4791 stop:5444 length:654 start_codon:yes stop_codon:yes gene_type:complete
MIKNDACTNMIKQQLRTGDVLDERILTLFATISREQFVPKEMREFAYSDMHIPLAHQQCMLTPLEEGRILQALQLNGTETVLEIGTGTGFMTALLSHLAARVISIDYHAEFTQQARVNLDALDRHNVELITADGYEGYLERAPFDVVIMTGAIPTITETHQLQLLPFGKLFAIVGRAPVMQGILYSVDDNNNWTQRLVFDTCVPSLINRLPTKQFVF